MDAIELYSNARREALAILYRGKDLNRDRPTAIEADFEEVAASCGHFSFSLQDFAEDTREYLQILDDLKVETEKNPRSRTWNWLKVWRYRRQDTDRDQIGDLGKNNTPCLGTTVG